MESFNHLDGSKILTVENTTESVERQTNLKEKIIFPMNSLTRFLGKTMPSPDGVMLLIGFLRFH